jgi:hypothetical protein
MSERAIEAAAAELKLTGPVTPESVRAAVLTCAMEDGFVLSPDRIAAARKLGCPIPMTDAAMQSLAKIEHADLTAFTQEFWTLAPTERLARWQSLNDSTISPLIRGELSRIAEALSTVVGPLDEPDLELADLACTLFLLPAYPRAVRRAEWYESRFDRMEFRSAAVRVDHLHLLDRPLFELLGIKFLAEPRPVSNRGSAGATWSGKNFTAVKSPLFPPVAAISEEDRDRYEANAASKAEARAMRQAAAGQPGPAHSDWYERHLDRVDSVQGKLGCSKWLILVVIWMVIRGCWISSQNDSRSPLNSPTYPTSPSTTPYQPRYQKEDDDLRRQHLLPIYNRMTEEQKKACENYEPRSNKSMPEFYMLWKLFNPTPPAIMK